MTIFSARIIKNLFSLRVSEGGRFFVDKKNFPRNTWCMKNIFHITSQASWENAHKQGFYAADSLEKEGFIHCSTVEQILRTANRVFRGQQGLVILEISEDKLKHEVKYEDLLSEGMLFPHIYGPLNLEAVSQVVAFTPQPDGTFKLPSEIK